MADLDLAEVLTHYDPPQLWFQLAEIVDERIYLRHGVEVNEGDTVLDVGANVGVAAAFFAAHCGAGLIHSFEPVGPIYELLRRNTERFGACVPHNYGLSSAAGRSEITFYPGAAAMSGLYADPELDRSQVRTVLLNIGRSEAEADAELAGRYGATTLPCELRTVSMVLREHSLERVDLLKVDVERAELDVLAGIAEQDWPKIDQIAMEIHDESGSLERAGAMLTQRGYEVAGEQDEDMRGTDVRMLYAVRPRDRRR
jgi:31-O-methyltransferase